MSDYRADIKLHFEIFGRTYDTELDIIYSPNNDGIDERIVAWFNDCYKQANAAYEVMVYEQQQEEREKVLEESERKELVRLKAKYEDKKEPSKEENPITS